MIGKFIIDSFKKEKPFKIKVKTAISFLKYYNNLTKALKSNQIYHNLESQNENFSDLLDCLKKDDLDFIQSTFKRNMIEFLKKNKLQTFLEFDKKTGFEQIGFNTIFVGNPVVGLWTTGKSTFFLPTKKDSHNKIIFEITSVPPLEVRVGFEGKEMKRIQMQKLSTKTLEFDITPNQVSDVVSEVFISTDKLWYPKFLLGTNDSILVGIKVNSIKIKYF